MSRLCAKCSEYLILIESPQLSYEWSDCELKLSEFEPTTS